MDITADEIITFWFDENTRKKWFNSTPQFDQLLTDKYQQLLESAAAGTLDHWRDTAEGALALCIILDQFWITGNSGINHCHAEYDDNGNSPK